MCEPITVLLLLLLLVPAFLIGFCAGMLYLRWVAKHWPQNAARWLRLR